MSGYVHREPGRVSRSEAVKSHTIYNQAVKQAQTILDKAQKQAHQIRAAALMRAEQDAKAIREAAYADGLALANTEFAATAEQRKAIGRLRLQTITNEIYEPKLRDAS